ncbi:UNVERIFIED_CONTAM: HD domain-containing protein [Williamsia faeni]
MSERSKQIDLDIVGIADAIAVEAHRGQTDKLGNDYIEHPRSVSRRVDPTNVEAVTAALLHDVIEDSEFTASDLVDRGIPATVVAAVQVLTRHKDVPDTDYYAAIVNDPVALAVKLADLADNTDPARLGLLDEAMQTKLITKYTKAFRALGRENLAAELASRRS